MKKLFLFMTIFCGLIFAQTWTSSLQKGKWFDVWYVSLTGSADTTTATNSVWLDASDYMPPGKDSLWVSCISLKTGSGTNIRATIQGSPSHSSWSPTAVHIDSIGAFATKTQVNEQLNFTYPASKIRISAVGFNAATTLKVLIMLPKYFGQKP